MKILLIEDEKPLADAIKELLSDHYDVTICNDGETGEYEALSDVYDLILLDVMLPIVDGFTILKECKENKIHTPIIMLTAKSELDDKLEGLENGADDYITKPFASRELLVRIKNLLTRSLHLEDTDELSYGDLTLNTTNASLKTSSQTVTLSSKELNILEMMFLNQSQILSKEQILEKIWGYETDAMDNNVEVYITFIRRKIKLVGSNVKIKAVRGLGYKLEYD